MGRTLQATLWFDPNSRCFEPRAEQDRECGLVSPATAASPGSLATRHAIEAPFPIHSKLQRLYGAVSCADRFSVDFDEPLSAGLPYLDGHGTTLQTFPGMKSALENFNRTLRNILVDGRRRLPKREPSR